MPSAPPEEPPPGDEELEVERREFLEFGDRFVRWMQTNEPDAWMAGRADRTVFHRMLLDPNLVAATAPRVLGMKFSSPAWQRELRRFPDRSAAARWLRLLAWYTLLRAERPDTGETKFGNNLPDMHYAFAALYTRHIWTQDQGLIDALNAVSARGVKVHTDPHRL